MTAPTSPTSSRRHFLAASIAAGGAVLSSPTVRAADKPLHLKKDDVVLFQGDSITDCGRDRKRTGANDRNALAFGYPGMIAAELLRDHPGMNLKTYNRGISGNKVPQLDDRWQADALDLKPAVLSILIGVNDIWHKLNGKYEGTTETFETGYRALLDRTLKALPDVQIVICEPFVLRCGAINDSWFPEFDDRRAVAKKMADEFKLCFVPFQSMFDQATKSAPPNYWAGDGVHPSQAGHSLMTKTWRTTTGL